MRSSFWHNGQSGWVIVLEIAATAAANIAATVWVIAGEAAVLRPAARGGAEHAAAERTHEATAATTVARTIASGPWSIARSTVAAAGAADHAHEGDDEPDTE